MTRLSMAEIEKLAERIESNPLGIAGVMMDDELAAGATLVRVGDVVPFAVPADDWEENCVISVLGLEARLVALLALRPGTGSLHRLVARINATKLIPVVVQPMGETMLAILRKWGWHRSVRGTGFTSVEEWRP